MEQHSQLFMVDDLTGNETCKMDFSKLEKIVLGGMIFFVGMLLLNAICSGFVLFWGMKGVSSPLRVFVEMFTNQLMS